MSLVIVKDTKNDQAAATRARGQHSRSCRCGQQLDVCVRAHCPRCGRSVPRP